MSTSVGVEDRPARVALTILADREQRRQLAEIAKREDRSVGSVVRAAVADYLARMGERGDAV